MNDWFLVFGNGGSGLPGFYGKNIVIAKKMVEKSVPIASDLNQDFLQILVVLTTQFPIFGDSTPILQHFRLIISARKQFYSTEVVT